MCLLEVILREGDLECVADIRRNSFKLRMLEAISYKEEGSEKAIGIREKARSVNLLLNDPELLSDERDKYKKAKSSNTSYNKIEHSYQDKFSHNPESYYDSPKKYERKSEVREKPKKKSKHKKEEPKEEPKKPTSELFDLLDIVEDNKEQTKAEALPNVFNSNPSSIKKPPNDLFDLLSMPESKPITSCNNFITSNSAKSNTTE